MGTSGQPEPEQRRTRFEATALPWLDALYRLAARLTHHGPDAADLVQETFLRAYRTFDNFRPGTNSRAWLFTIMYSIFINQQRARGRRGSTLPIDDLDQAELQGPLAVDPDERSGEIDVGGVSVGPEVDGALRQVPDEFRVAVLLVDGHDMSYEEAAAVIGCPVGTVRSRLFRGRKLLATLLREHATRSGFGRLER